MAQGTTVLVVDDDPNALVLMGHFLKSLGVPQVNARSGFEALEILRSDEPIALVILDIAMPGMNGIKLAERIRGELGLPDLPLVALSARVDLQTQDMALDAGINEFIYKPFTPDSLRAVLATYGIIG
ncbi:MAG: response regulator [Chloroflexi bacterium]|nr:response regulator [Chloroflexota bacterium]